MYIIDGKDRTIEFLEVALRDTEENLDVMNKALDYTDIDREGHYPYQVQKFLVKYLKERIEAEKENIAIDNYMSKDKECL